MPPKGFAVQNKCATSWLQCPNSNSRGKTWPTNTRERTLLNVVVERWLDMLVDGWTNVINLREETKVEVEAKAGDEAFVAHLLYR
eukprot:SAG31_NODE_792_length_12047_cov_14.428607_10_plen_85_part_00